jgi:hypothetical protein
MHFFPSSLKSITILRHVQILCSDCFSHSDSLSSISFEMDSELTGIEAEAFAAAALSLVAVPVNVSFIAGDAFPVYCAVTMAAGDSDAAFGEWAGRNGSGSGKALERRT